MMAISLQSRIGAWFLLAVGWVTALILTRATAPIERIVADELKAQAESLASAIAEQQRVVFEEERGNRIFLQYLVETLGGIDGLRGVELFDENAVSSALSRCWRHLIQARHSTQVSQPRSIARKAVPMASMHRARI